MSCDRDLAYAVAALWVLPLWVVRFPPMVDYPQQLALAAILRWYSDPARRFRETYELALGAPHGLWKLLVAGLAWIAPIDGAGQLVVSLSLVAVGAAALALCRRAGRPDGHALLALALTYNSPSSGGSSTTCSPIPWSLAGVALADQPFERPITPARGWPWPVRLLLYTVHLQFLLLFAGAVGWLALARAPGWKRLALGLSALVPGLALGLGVMAVGVFALPVGVVTAYERRLRDIPTIWTPITVKLARLPDLLFGAHADGSGWLLLALLLAFGTLVIATRVRERAARGGGRPCSATVSPPSPAGWRSSIWPRRTTATPTSWPSASRRSPPWWRSWPSRHPP